MKNVHFGAAVSEFLFVLCFLLFYLCAPPRPFPLPRRIRCIIDWLVAFLFSVLPLQAVALLSLWAPFCCLSVLFACPSVWLGRPVCY